MIMPGGDGGTGTETLRTLGWLDIVAVGWGGLVASYRFRSRQKAAKVDALIFV